MENKLSNSEKSLAERLAESAAQQTKLAEVLNAWVHQRPCDISRLCEIHQCPELQDQVAAEVERLEYDYQLIKAGDAITVGCVFTRIASIICQQRAFDLRLDGPVVCHDIDFYDEAGEYHCWKSWIDGGEITRKDGKIGEAVQQFKAVVRQLLEETLA